MAVFNAIVVIGMLATAGVLLSGLVSMARGGDFDQRHSHQLMFARVGLQGITLLLLFLALLVVAR